MPYLSRLPLLGGIALLALSGACAVGPSTPEYSTDAYLHDEAFPAAAGFRVESMDEVFELDADARAYLDRKIARIRDDYKRSVALRRELFHQAELNLSYTSNANTTASETFRQRRANCLSMSILAYSMARHVGFDASFQEVDLPDFWERRDGYSLVNRHVNLLLRPENRTNSMLVLHSYELEVDFQPLDLRYHPPTRLISKWRALAMFYNNKAVDALLQDEDALAYAYLAAAVETDPALDMALVNLGLLYRKQGHDDWAEAAYRKALDISSENMVAADALAVLLREDGRAREAEQLLARVKDERAANPYFQFILGEEAYDAGNFDRALVFYRKALALKPGTDSFHFGMARAYVQLGRYDLAELHLRKAERFAGFDDLKQKYGNKLSALKSM